MEASVQIGLVRENLALAIALWGAAQRGVITAGFVPNRSEFVTPGGRLVKVAAPLEVHDTQGLVRCVNNQVRGAFAFSAIQTNHLLETVYGNSPIADPDSDLQAARCILYLISKSVSHNMIEPTWACPPDYRRKFRVQFASFALDASALDGKKIYWDHFGGLNKYLDLLEYCGVEVAGYASEAEEPAPEEEAEELPSGPTEAPAITDGKPDPIASFVADCCTVGTREMIIAKDLYDVYVTWCQQQGHEPLVQRSFGMRLTALGFQRRRRGQGRHWWLGIGLSKASART